MAQRPAMVAKAIAQLKKKGVTGVTDAESLYEYLLLDVNLTQDVRTSRLMEAVGSVQLYGHRVIQGIERVLGFTDKPALVEAWRYDQEYDLWQANEQLALYPERFLAPEAPRGASEHFRTFRDAINQGRLDDTAVQRAILPYLGELSAEGRAQIGGMSQIEERDGSLRMWMTARVLGDTGDWFLRSLRINSWGIFETTAWEKIEVPISKKSFTVPTPVWFQGKVHLFWAEIDEETVKPEVQQQFLRLKQARRIGESEWSDATVVPCGMQFWFGKGEVRWGAQPVEIVFKSREETSFGASVSVSGDGSILVVGAPRESGVTTWDTPAARRWRWRCCTGWGATAR